MTPDALDIGKLRELLEKATPGPWTANPFGFVFFGHSEIAARAIPADAALTAALRNAAPALLDRLEAVEREVERLRKENAARKDLCTAYRVGNPNPSLSTRSAEANGAEPDDGIARWLYEQWCSAKGYDPKPDLPATGSIFHHEAGVVRRMVRAGAEETR